MNGALSSSRFLTWPNLGTNETTSSVSREKNRNFEKKIKKYTNMKIIL